VIQKSNLKLLGWYLPIVSLISLFIYLGFFGTASSDDYADFMQVEKFGYFNTVKETYLHWGGRFTSYILVYPINPLNFGEEVGPIIFNTLQICLFASLSFLNARFIVKKNFKNIEFCICFSLLAFLLFCYLPKPVELLYWFTGSWVYLPGLIGISFWLLLSESKQITAFQKTIYIVLPFFIAGTNELNLLIEAWLLFVYGILIKPKKLYWFALISFLIGASLALLTPGNNQRSDFFLLQAHHPARDFGFTLLNCFKLSFHYLKDWLRSSPILLIWFCISFLLPNRNLRFSKKEIALIFLSFLMIPMLFFPFIYGTGMLSPPERLLNVVYIFISLAGAAIFPQLIHTYFSKVKFNPLIASIIGIVLLFQASYTSRLRSALFDLDEVMAYQIETKNRIELAKNHAVNSPNDTLLVPSIRHIPYSIFYSDLNSNAGHWYNQGFAYYHKIKAVKVVENKIP